MQYNEWKNIYYEIIRDFSYNVKDDEKSALILSKVVDKEKLIEPTRLEKIIYNKTAYIFGAAVPSKITNNFDGVIISADGATTALLENDILPDIIVSDLDGIIDDLLIANQKGSTIIIHAHGDNIEVIQKYVPEFQGKIFCTTQSKPFGTVFNFGGFTDGDRAVFIAEHFGTNKIKLVGFDFERIGRYSFSKNNKIKLKKLKWAKKLINIIDKSKISYL